jgi:tetratricopeptide (TPR) repeat protein
MIFRTVVLSTLLAGGSVVALRAAPQSDTPAPAEGPFHFALATMLVGEGRLEEAARMFELALEADPKAAFPRVEYAEVLLRIDRVQEALARSEEALALAPGDPDVLRGYGQVQLSVARTDRQAIERAMHALERLREVAPDDVAGMVTLGQIYQSMGRHRDAVDVFQELVNHHTDHRQLRRLLVDALTAAGETERARAVLEELIRIDQESLENRLALAQLESEKGNHGTAIEILEAGIDDSGAADPQLRIALAQELVLRSQSPGLSARQRESDLSRALELLDRLLEDAYDFGLVARRARVLALLDRSAEAETALREAWKRLPEDVRPPLQLARLLESTGRESEAAEVLQTLLANGRTGGPATLEVRQRLAALEARRGNWKAVLDQTEALLGQLDTATSRAEIVAIQAEALVRLDRPQKALDLLEREEQRFGPDPRLLLGRADLLGELDRDQEAFAVLSRPELAAATEDELFFGRVRSLLALEAVEAAVSALRQHGEQGGFEGLVRAGQFLSLHGRFVEAVPFLQDAIERGADEPVEDRADAHFFLGQAFERTGRYDDAASEFRRVLELREDDSTAMNYLGYMWADQGVHLEQALALVERAVALQPENGAYVDSLGWAQFRLGRFDAARQSLERAAELTPDNATIHEHLGDVYLALDDVARARAAYERALQLDDEDVEKVREKLARLPAGSQ